MRIIAAVKNLIFFSLLLIIVLYANAPVISFDMMYPEQPTIYLANQTIHNFNDFLNLYLHPKWLNANIMFFRPSGHFLIYQLIVPFIGWHNTRAMLIFNFTMLAIIGFLMVKVYRLLFPNYLYGGLVAFGIYLMHPALSISRLTLMHFEFAYVLCVMLSLYCFLRFCQKKQPNADYAWSYFFMSLIAYIFAVTLKEPALMLGPVLVSYYCLSLYHGQPIRQFVRDVLQNQQSRSVLFCLSVVTIVMVWYLTLSWPSYGFASGRFNWHYSIGTLNAFFKDILGLPFELFPYAKLPFDKMPWRTIVFTAPVKLILISLFSLSIVIVFKLFYQQIDKLSVQRRSISFLMVASLLFLIIPLGWGMGAPWHHSLTLMTLCFIMGFCVEDLMPKAFCMLLFLLFALLTRDIDQKNIQKYMDMPEGKLGLTLNRNAVLFPPNIKAKLNATSMIVVEDSVLHNDYLLGNATYPYLLFLGEGDYDLVQKQQQNYYLPFHHTYSSNLFRYAYLMPTLKEELYPFEVEKMTNVPNEVIYRWYKGYNNIFCLGYDKNATWVDKTNLFKINLTREFNRRGLVLHQYAEIKETSLTHYQLFDERQLTVPDKVLCEYYCDQNVDCHAYIYQHLQCRFLKRDFSSGHQFDINYMIIEKLQ